MFDLKQLRHDNARLAAFLATPQTTGRIRIRMGSRCMASIMEPTAENSHATRRVAGKLVMIMPGKPELVSILHYGKRYLAEAEGLSGDSPLCAPYGSDIPEEEQCEWQDVYALLRRRRNDTFEIPNVYTLLEQLLSVEL